MQDGPRGLLTSSIIPFLFREKTPQISILFSNQNVMFSVFFLFGFLFFRENKQIIFGKYMYVNIKFCSILS